MTSSMITGERRWASARRGGMTVLGKVAVPKPINLPSQKLENHGLDPTVEIVPKGTLSWGSRPSSAGSNAWGTSALSPSTDGGGSSPSHLAGRPLSGGGTRPSTSGSERANDSNVSAWGPNSRPSSASGVLGSNHASLTSSRPRSADTRPGSSHLSRFADHSPEVSGAWGASASERTEGASSNKGFSLSSGDFPTLGSEKDESGRDMEPSDHASHRQPGFDSGEGKGTIESKGILHGDDARESDIKGNFRGKDCPPYVEDGPRPKMERWHGDPHLYHNPNMGPSHYESWRGPPPMNPPGGVWYGGPPGPPPYGGPVPPGGFHMEPFQYYRPQVPAPGLANSQPIPPPGPGHHGHHPKNGDMYRPHIPEPFMRPGMPMRPGFYPGPVPYDPYHRPPMGFCNPNERELSFMGMASGPPVYNRPPNQNAPDLTSSYPGSHDTRGPDQVDPGSLHNPRGNCKILVKSNDGWNQHDEEKWGHRVNTDVINHEKGILSKATGHENAWGDDYKKDESIYHGESATVEDIPSRPFETRYNSGNLAHPKFPGEVKNVEERSTGPNRDSITSSQDHSLIKKLEGLNAKVRSTDGRQDGIHREELTDRVQVVNVKAHQSVNEAKNEVVLERHYPSGILVPVSRDSEVGTAGKSGEFPVTTGPRRAVHGAQSRGSSHGKGSFNAQEDHSYGKKPQSHSVPALGSRSTTAGHAEDCHTNVQPTEGPKANVETKCDGDSAIDTTDVQRARMREIARQRAIQLQKEEEERIREQKAKALAKLEELNRRSASQGSVPGQKDSGNKDYPRVHLETEAISNTGSSSDSSNNTALVEERNASKIVDLPVTSSRRTGAETKRIGNQDLVTSQMQSPTANVNFDDASSNRTAPQVIEVSKPKRVGYKQRQNVPSEKSFSEDQFPVGRTDVLKDHTIPYTSQEVGVREADRKAGKELSEPAVVADTPAAQKRRNNKSGKSKHKMEESSTAVSSVSRPSSSSVAQSVSGSVESNASTLPVKSIPVQLTDAKELIQSSENHSSLSREDAHGRVNNAWKPQHSRKARTTQSSRSTEKTQCNDGAVWAPVRSHNKVEVPEQTSEIAAELIGSSVAGDNTSHVNSRTKRAEMERYVPKPVAKELAQQGGIQQPPSFAVDQTISDGQVGGEKASQGSESVVKSGPFVESRHVEGKNRHARGQGSWRQRVSVETDLAHASQDISSSTMSNSKNIETSGWVQDTVSPIESMRKEQQNRPDKLSVKVPDTSASDGWNSVNSDSNSSSVHTGVKDHLPSGRGRRHPFKGQKSSGSHQSFGNKVSNAGLIVSPRSPESNLTEKTQFPKENRAAGDRLASQWQPKSQASVVLNHQGHRSSRAQNYISEDGKGSKRDIGSGDGARSHSHSLNNQFTVKDSRPGSEDTVLGEAMPNMRHHGYKREKRGSHVKGRPQSPYESPVVEIESAALGAVDVRNEQRPSSGYRKNSNYNGRANRVHESRGDWGTAAQESKQHHLPANRERQQRQNSHYEYQRVGPYYSNDSAPQFEDQAGGPRIRERGQNHSRRGRGNFYGRQSGNE